MFDLVSPFAPAGDQPQAIAKLTEGLSAGARHQVLLGVTGSGKTFTIANVIKNVDKPTLVLSHNKTLAAQLYAEFKGFFPRNAVEYFVSYFDFYQPEAYIPRTDTFIEKDSSTNDDIERLRLSAMSSLFARRDVVVVASVSCIYGIGSREDYEAMLIHVAVGAALTREQFLSRLVDLQYTRNDIEFQRGQFRVRGDVVEMCPAYREDALRIEFFGEEVERITRFDPLTGNKIESLNSVTVFPGKQFVTPPEKLKPAVLAIRAELGERIAWFEKHGKLLEAQRIKMRTEYDLEMMQEMGFCSGIENYSRHIAGRAPDAQPCTLMDFLPKDYLLVIDESHATVPQIGGMHAGDRSRKTTLVEYGFRLPSALDNRPLRFEEFQSMQGQTIYVSATPGPRELEWAKGSVTELVVRPTGLIDPRITLKPLAGQIDDLIEEARKRVELKERILVTTLTKRTAEELTDYLRELGINVRYLHSEIDAIERVEILRSLRKGEFDVLVGINLLREGLDIPEVSLVAILDADKEGFLRSTRSLIQTMGRAARHLNGTAILYADRITDSMQRAMGETSRRRARQVMHNEVMGIVPTGVSKRIKDIIDGVYDAETAGRELKAAQETARYEVMSEKDMSREIRRLEKAMLEHARNLEFEAAATARDELFRIKQLAFGGEAHDAPGDAA